MVSIAIAGDLYPGSQSTPYLAKGETEPVFGSLLEILKESDLRVFNLEGPLINEPSPINKIGPVHAIEQDCIQGLQNAGFDVANLGNNHLMDHGPHGLENTVRHCRENGISCVGAGENLHSAEQVLIRDVKGLRVAFLSYCEHEFGVATAGTCGVNPLDLIHFIRTVTADRKRWDYLVVLLHGGNEYYPYPRPKLRNLCQLMIEQGANAVILQHSHCAGCYEKYKGGYIIYGQGNFLFDERSSRDCEKDGALVLLDIEGPGQHQVRFVPIAHSASRPGPERMGREEEVAFLRGFEDRSKALNEPGFVEREWECYTRSSAARYLSLLHGYGRRIRELDQKFHFLHPLYSKRRILMLLHLIRCESHRDTIIDALAQEVV